MAIVKTGLVRGFTPAQAGREIDTMLRRAGVNGNPFSRSAVASLVRPNMIAAPETIDVPGLNIKAAASIVTGRQIAQLAASGYAIEGHDKDSLIAACQGNATAGIGYLSKPYGDKLAEAINQQNPGRSFRLPTEKELLTIFEKLKNQISGIKDHWIWTSDETEPNSGRFVLRYLSCGIRGDRNPENRYTGSAVLLVEDKK